MRKGATDEIESSIVSGRVEHGGFNDNGFGRHVELGLPSDRFSCGQFRPRTADGRGHAGRSGVAGHLQLRRLHGPSVFAVSRYEPNDANVLAPNRANLLYNSGRGMLSAATSPDGRFGAVARDVNSTPMSAAVVGGSATGFGTPITDVQAIDFNSQGALVLGYTNMLPTLPGLSQAPLVDIAVSPTGDIGAINANMVYYQNSPLLGGWGGVDLRSAGPSLIPDSMNLAMDSAGRPHLLGLANPSQLIAYDFDIPNGRWQSQVLAGCTISMPFGATIAADSRGGVGAAWVQTDGGSIGTLKYAYNDGENGWVSRSVTTSVFNPLSSSYEPVFMQQGVGLVFDANDFPVISFVTAAGNICLAYDPVTVPEPSTLVLLAVGGTLMLLTTPVRRLAGHPRKRSM